MSGAYAALRATLHAVCDRRTVEETAHLGAQLPMLIRGLYHEAWDPTGKPVRVRDLESFRAARSRSSMAPIASSPSGPPARSSQCWPGRVSDGEIEDVKDVLPADIRSLWP
jgi:uncharacterized protein (DUF2267 family)